LQPEAVGATVLYIAQLKLHSKSLAHATSRRCSRERLRGLLHLADHLAQLECVFFFEDGQGVAPICRRPRGFAKKVRWQEPAGKVSDLGISVPTNEWSFEHLGRLAAEEHAIELSVFDSCTLQQTELRPSR